MKSAKILTIFSTKGGVGKTIVATNLAAGLYYGHRAKVVLVELAPASTDAAKMLSATDLHPICEPWTPETLSAALKKLSAAHDYIIIDGVTGFTRLSLAALDQSHLILLVTTPDLIAIQHTTQTIEQLESLQIPKRMIQVVLNRAGSWGNFGGEEVKGYLPVDVITEIPSDGRSVSLSVNRGTPCVLMPEKSRISDALKHFAQTVLRTPSLFVEHVSLDHAKAATLVNGADASGLPAGPPAEPAPAASPATDTFTMIKRQIHSKVMEELDVNLKRLDPRALNDPQEGRKLRQKVEALVLDLMTRQQGYLANAQERTRFVKEISDEILALGPLQDLIDDSDISDILVNGPDMIYVEKRGKLTLTDKKFISSDQLLTVIERILAPLGRRIDEMTPLVDARLADGSRVNAVIPPLSLTGPVLSIRKFRRERYTPEDFITLGAFDARMVEFIRMCVQGRKNIIVSGGTGSGKTTLLNMLSAFIPEDERIVTIEDAAELRLAQRHWVPLEARLPNIEGKGAISIRHLFRNTLRMRPDRIIIGECRGDETLDMLQAMNTGHDGSMTTLHANSPQDVVARLDALVLMSNVELPVRAVREQIASALHVIIHTARLSDGTRKVTHITELAGIDPQADTIALKDVFVFAQEGLDVQGKVLGSFRATGHIPEFVKELRTKGIRVSDALFAP